jgi:hypothetical protein
LPKKTAHKEIIFHCKIRPLIDKNIRRPYKKRIQQKLREIPGSSNILLEMGISKT